MCKREFVFLDEEVEEKKKEEEDRRRRKMEKRKDGTDERPKLPVTSERLWLSPASVLPYRMRLQKSCQPKILK